jgi:DNA-binding transcriptional LysR family regulator
MDFNQLQAFDLVVRLGSFSKAARHLNLSQPTISIRIQGLEKVVGGGLFYRVGKRVELTDIGRGFLPYARQALDALSKGIERTKSIKEGKMGQIIIGTLPTFTSGIFSSTIADLHKNYPNINIEIHTGHNQQITEMLYDGFIKIGLLTNPYFNTDLKNLFLIKEPLVLVAHYSNPISLVKDLTTADIIQESKPYIIVDWSEEAKHWQKSLLNPRVDFLEVPPSTALDLVCLNDGISLLTESMVSDLIKSNILVKIKPLDFPKLYREIVMVSLEPEDTLSPALKTFVSVFKSHYK